MQFWHRTYSLSFTLLTLLTLIRPPWGYSSAAFRGIMPGQSKFLNVIFETFLMNPCSQFLKLFPKALEISSWSQLVHLNFAKKWGKFNFFYVTKHTFFFMKLNSTWKMRSFEVHNVDVGQNLKLANFQVFSQNRSWLARFDIKFLKILENNSKNLFHGDTGKVSKMIFRNFDWPYMIPLEATE